MKWYKTETIMVIGYMQSSKPKKLSKQILLGLAMGLLLSLVIVAVKVGPRVFHEGWLKRGSAYNVEYESLYVNCLQHIRDGLYASHLDFLDAPFRRWQQTLTDKAFRKIPEQDGERIIWQLWLNRDFWRNLNKNENPSQIMPSVLKYIDALTTLPTSSQWASLEKFEFTNKLVNFFYHNYAQSGLSADQIYEWQLKIVTRMNQLEPQLDEKKYLAESTPPEQLTPLFWNDNILVGASYLLYEPKTHLFHCDRKAFGIFVQAKHKLQNLVLFYKPLLSDSYSLKWLKDISAKIQPNTEEVIRNHCPID